MSATKITRFAVMLAVIGFTAGCANTIRGVGRDAANTVNATQAAGNDIEESTY